MRSRLEAIASSRQLTNALRKTVRELDEHDLVRIVVKDEQTAFCHTRGLRPLDRDALRNAKCGSVRIELGSAWLTCGQSARIGCRTECSTNNGKHFIGIDRAMVQLEAELLVQVKPHRNRGALLIRTRNELRILLQKRFTLPDDAAFGKRGATGVTC